MFKVGFYETCFLAVFLCLPYLLLQTYVWTCIIGVGTLYYLLEIIRQQRTGRINVNGQGVLITGCDTGFGHSLAKHLDRIGFTVFAGCLQEHGPGANNLRTSGSGNLHVLGLDVTSEDSVESALHYISSHLPPEGLWGVVCNAGIMVFGDVEFLSASDYYRCLNVNFLGVVRVVKSFLPLIRKSRGRIIMTSSVRGQYPNPGASAYNVGKYALETYGDTLRLEMNKFKVKVSLIQPGKYGTATSIINPEKITQYEEEGEKLYASAKEEVRSVYGKTYVMEPIHSLRRVHRGSDDMSPVLRAFEDALSSESPKHRYIVGGGDSYIDTDALLSRVYGKLPTWLTDYYVLWRTNTFTFPPGTRADKQQ